MGRIGDLYGRPNTAPVPKHGDAIIIGDFAIAGDDCLYEHESLFKCKTSTSGSHPLSRMRHVMPVRDIESSSLFDEVNETQSLCHVRWQLCG